jgi:tetratricopeptide (TPR) repeat protein
VRAQAFAHRRLAYACMLLGHDADAGVQLSQALRLYENSGDAYGQSVVHHSLSNLYDHGQDPTRALHHAEQALTWAEQAEDANEQAAALNAIGWCHAQLGHHVEALTYCQRALRLIDPNNHRALADTWDSIGFAHHHLSDFAQAADAYRHALTLARQAGARHLEATVLTHLGDTHHTAGEHAAAHDAWEPALKIMVDIDATAADEIRDRIAAPAEPSSASAHCRP